MNFLQSHVAVEQLIRAVRTAPSDVELRKTVYKLLDEERRDAAREHRILIAAVLAVAGGHVRVPPEVIAEVGPQGVMEVTGNPDGSLELRGVDLPADVVALVQMLTEQGRTVVTINPPPAPATDYPPANRAEPDPVARIRIAEAIRLFCTRHYDGETHERGLDFMVTVFGELLAMALGIKLARADEANEGSELAILVQQLAPRLTHYHDVAKQHADQQQQPEPGDPTPPVAPSSRVM